ncbi:hypothetical protein B0H17DRAFT_926293, partial [Mycena rosella]
TMDSSALDTYRLPTLATPVHYDLKIRTDLKTLCFDGAVEVKLTFDADTPTIVLNVVELELGATSEWVPEYYAATFFKFFEPTYARRVFPCWDEPALKATFAISLISRAGTVNLSNMAAAFEGPYDPA